MLRLCAAQVRRGADAHLPDATPGRKTPVDKCEDTHHRVTLNAVLVAANQFRAAVADQDRAAREAHAKVLARSGRLERSADASWKKLAQQVGSSLGVWGGGPGTHPGPRTRRGKTWGLLQHRDNSSCTKTASPLVLWVLKVGWRL